LHSVSGGTGVIARLVAVACLASGFASRPVWGIRSVLRTARPGRKAWVAGLPMFASRSRKGYGAICVDVCNGRAIGIRPSQRATRARTSCTHAHLAHTSVSVLAHMYMSRPAASRAFSTAQPTFHNRPISALSCASRPFDRRFLSETTARRGDVGRLFYLPP
jgi:hypothetical protein